jgi:hypothetical protein
MTLHEGLTCHVVVTRAGRSFRVAHEKGGVMLRVSWAGSAGPLGLGLEIRLDLS